MSEIVLHHGSVESLRALAESWVRTANGEKLGVIVDTDHHLADLQELVDHAVLLVLQKDGRPVGYLGITVFKSPVGPDLVAQEHYYYVHPDHRGIGSIRLLDSARACAKALGAKYMLFSASTLASDLHDAVCRLYERKGMQRFETTYLSSL